MLSKVQEYALQYLNKEIQLQHPSLSPLANALIYEMKNFFGKVDDTDHYQKIVDFKQFEKAVNEIENCGFVLDKRNQNVLGFPSLEILIEDTIKKAEEKNEKFSYFLKQIKPDGYSAFIDVMLYEYFCEKK